MHTSEKFSIDYKDGKYDCKYVSKEWEKDSAYLPKKDSYIMAELGEFDDDIEYFTSIEEKIQYAFQNEYYSLINKLELLDGASTVAVGELSSHQTMELSYQERLPEQCKHHGKYSLNFCQHASVYCW